MNFFARKQQLWRIERWRQGRYVNSPKVWSVCGVIRARDRTEATLDAAFRIGSSQVRAVPLDQEVPEL